MPWLVAGCLLLGLCAFFYVGGAPPSYRHDGRLVRIHKLMRYSFIFGTLFLTAPIGVWPAFAVSGAVMAICVLLVRLRGHFGV